MISAGPGPTPGHPAFADPPRLTGLDRADLAAIAISALLLSVATAPSWVPGLVFVALVPFLLRWARRRRHATLRSSALYGAAFFTVFWALHLVWVLRILRVAAWPLPAWAGQVAALGLLGAVLGVGLHGVRRLPLVVGAPVVWVGVEVLRADALGPLRFAWSPIALGVAESVLLIQPAAVVGEAGIGVGIVAVSAFVAAGLYRATSWYAGGLPATGMESRGSAWSRFALAGVVLGGWVLWSSPRTTDADRHAPVATVVAVQPVVPLAVKRDSARAVEASIAAIEELLPAAVRAGAGELVLPETALPLDLTGERGGEVIDRWLEMVGRPIWVGGFEATGDGRLLNVVRRYAPGSDGADGPEARWAKIALVPGVEAGWGSRYARGDPSQPPVNGVGPLICIEATREGIARRHAARGARWLLNVTNDAWLAEDPVWTRTRAFDTHPAHLRLRAVETGLGIARVGNNGRTGVIDPDGRWTERIPAHLGGVRTMRVRSAETPTAYVRWGWWLRRVVLAALLLAVGAALIEGAGRTRSGVARATD